MIDQIENVTRELFVRFGSKPEHWDEASLAEREAFRQAAEDLLHEFASLARLDTAELVEKIRETRRIRPGFLYMIYSLNTSEAAALHAFRALGRPQC
jgi:acyl-CoA reductase-like NAD-dependent aldehyde dehydrogenase